VVFSNRKMITLSTKTRHVLKSINSPVLARKSVSSIAGANQIIWNQKGNDPRVPIQTPFTAYLSNNVEGLRSSRKTRNWKLLKCSDLS
jgi:hypothetical protein